MKNHKKYAKLPQDLDLSFQQQLDVDTAATDDFNLTGSGLDDDDDNILGDQDAAADDEDEVIEDDDEEDEVVYATAAAAATGLSGTGSCGLRLVGATAAARKQQLNKKVLSGLGRDSVIEKITKQEQQEQQHQQQQQQQVSQHTVFNVMGKKAYQSHFSNC
uniref:Uncharacterized protein n=1 Tax=Glossina pallidipes TaxID=7398 RepID=A0A1B0A2D1_GLOPL